MEDDLKLKRAPGHGAVGPSQREECLEFTAGARVANLFHLIQALESLDDYITPETRLAQVVAQRERTTYAIKGLMEILGIEDAFDPKLSNSFMIEKRIAPAVIQLTDGSSML